MAKEIIVTKPSECPFQCYNPLNWDGVDCNLRANSCNSKADKFPPDCPLFENDYLIKRRTNNGVT